MVTVRPASLRERLSARVGRALVRGDRSIADHMLSEAYFWRHAFPALSLANLWQQLGSLGSRRRDLLRHRLVPFEVRLFRHHLPEVAEARGDLFLQLDLQALQHGRSLPALETKSGFAAACQQHGLPHVPTHLPGPDRKLPDAMGLPLFLKPDRARRARGCAVLQHGADGTGTLLHDGTARMGEIDELLASHYPGEALVAQPLLANADEVAAVVGPVVLTLRLVTGIADGDAELLSALAEIPLDDRLPLATKWAICPVNRDAGTLAEIKRNRPDPSDPHPLTGKTLSGWRVPRWDAIRTCAERAHMLIARDMAMVGWDLALTEEGPVLIEGNTHWAVATHCRNSAGFSLEPARRFACFVRGDLP